MNTQHHTHVPHKTQDAEPGIDLEAAYQALVKAFLRSQFGLRGSGNMRNTPGATNQSDQKIDHEDRG